MAAALEVGEPELDNDNLPQVEDMVSVCEGLVTVDEESNIIRLVHYTMQEYFERLQKRWFVNTEDDITITCIKYLSFSTSESGFCRTDKEFEERLQSNQFYDYAARNWGYHARAVFPTLSSLVLMFLESEAKVEASSQVIMASRLYSIHSPYRWDSQRIPKQIKAVHLAAYFGLSEAMKCLLAYGHCPNLKDTYNRTPLWYAAYNGHENVIKVLLGENGVDPDCKDNYGRTPLSWAAEKGHEVVVKQLLANDRVNPNFKDPFHRQTALWRAADKGHEKVVKLLLKEGVDPDCKDKYGQTPLLIAIGRRHSAVLKAFFESGVRLKDIEALLWTAVKNKDTAMIQALLENGFDLERKNNKGQTPLSYAAANGHEGVVTLLLEKGAELETKDYDWTPLLYAARNGHEAVVKLLLEKGAELETKGEGYGQAPLSYAAEKGHEVVVKLLLEKGAELDTKDKCGRTPLLYAAENGHEAVVKKLLEKGAELETKDKYSRTPLSWAAYYGCEAVVKLLLERGAELEIKSDCGWTPLLWAASNGHCKTGFANLSDSRIRVYCTNELANFARLANSPTNWPIRRFFVKLVIIALVFWSTFR